MVSMLAPETLLQNRYRIVRLIGKGGMGAVYEAIDQRLNVAVALKQTSLGGTQFDAAFKREARLLATLRHPALPVVSDYFSEDNQHFLVMQLIQGADLATLLAQHDAPFPLHEVLRWADQLLDALEYLHRQKSPIIHRDIKPQNLKLTPEGALILLDFGLARGAALARAETEPLHSMYGFTPQYAPLEQIRGEGTGPRSDLYALAATLYHLLTNLKPPDALHRASAILEGRSDPLRPANDINLHIPSPVSAVIHAALSLDPAQRPVGAAEMRVLLHQALTDQPTSVAPPTLAERAVPASTGAQSIARPARPSLVVPPTGTITFLFADIVTSTAQWEQQPQVMQAAIERYDTLLRVTIDAQHGYLCSTVSDIRCVAFATAADALAAAVALQRALANDARDRLSVRIALHTGAVEARAGEYIGPPLNRGARLLAAGQAGQILLSRVTQELVHDHMPPDLALRDLGEYRLTDLSRPERVFQLVAPDLPTDFAPLLTLESHSNNLPTQLTPLIGRERESAAIRQLLLRDDLRLLTLIGTGGTGKTRLSLQVAADLLHRFADGVFFVPLATISDPDLVIPTVAQALGVKDSGGQPIFESLVAHQHDKHLLLVLDNCEQVSAAAPQIAALLGAVPHLKLLATSREVLRISGEQTFTVPPLSLPERRRDATVEQVTQYEAVRLFIARAQAVRSDFQVTSANAPAVAEICYRLDGLPLAIELAAARIRMLNPQALLDRLSSRLTLLTGGARDLPARQQTIRNAIDWSYDLLDEGEQLLFRRLAVFVGGRSLEATEIVCQAGGALPLDVFDGMASLLDKSLLYQTEGPDGAPRFMMLETIGEYARERLAASGELAALQQAHAAYYLDMVRQAAPGLQGADQRAGLDYLEAEHDNIRAALRWDVEAGNGMIALELVGILWRFWDRRGYLSEGLGWIDTALAHSAAAPAPLRAQALHAAGNLARNQGDYRRAGTLYEQALALRSPDDTRGIASTLHGIGNNAYDQGDYARATATIEQCLEIFRQLGERELIALELMVLGEIAWCQADYPRAQALATESMARYRELGDTWGVGMALSTLGQAADDQGRYEQAQALLEEARDLLHAIGYRRGVGLALNYLATVALHCGDDARASTLSEESLALFHELGEQWGAAKALDNLGVVALRQNNTPHAIARFEESLALYRKTGDRRGIAIALHSRGRAALQQGDELYAQELFSESLAIYHEIGDQHGLVYCLEALADLSARQAHPDQAARLLGGTEVLREAIGAPLPPAEQPDHERAWARLRADLGESAAADAQHQGRRLTVDQIIADLMHAERQPSATKEEQQR
jgi:predicted ATPase/class 3 adenylate cyclase